MALRFIGIDPDTGQQGSPTVWVDEDIALPGNDCWVFDAEIVLFNHFSGDGDWSEPGWEVRSEPAVARLASAAFEAVWERGVPHEKYSV
ncbi:DUF6879 family protein [Streptomyces sp. NPDC093093]|uniref:DUF6879 family protein n=1 Tax=Streptomyces sp. NPDC093093 TaxID=3366025 RepID=UPI00382BD052